MSRGSSIVLLTGTGLCHNPRVIKEASALSRAGHEVRVLGGWLDASTKSRDLSLLAGLNFEFVPVVDLTSPGMRHVAARFLRRASGKAAHLAYGATGFGSPLQLGFGVPRLFSEALRRPAHLYIAHSESGLHAGWKLLRAGRRVGVDMEDWFSEDQLPEARRGRPLRLLRFLERQLLSEGVYASCPSRAMSTALARHYGCAPPTPIYNAFAWSDRTALGGEIRDRRNGGIPSLHWYSTTLGHGRGLEQLLDALALVTHDAEIHLRGNPAAGFEDWVKARAPERWRQRIFLHPPVPNGELLARVAEHDIGFAGETKYCRSRDLTVTNKILHYLLGGLAVVASDTSGQLEVSERAPGAVLHYPSGNAEALAQALDGLLASPERLRSAKAAALDAAQETFCWERQEGVLLDAVAHALDRSVADRPTCAAS